MNIELQHLISKTQRTLYKLERDEGVQDSELIEVLEECLEQLYRLKDLEW